MAIKRLKKRSLLGVQSTQLPSADKINEIIDAVNEILPSDGTIEADTINEETAAAGVTVDSVLLKDGTVKTAAGAVGSVAIKLNADGDGFYAVSGTQIGVAVDGVLKGGFDSSGLFTGTISEQVATAGVTVDGLLIKDGGATANSMYATFMPTGATNNITAGTGGAISVTNFFTTINTDAGGDAFTLANGTQIGQLKKIYLVADGGGDAVITPTSLSGGTTITMDDANDYVQLLWNGTAWVVVENFGSTVA